MATESGKKQVEYQEGGVEILADLPKGKPDRGHRQETWEQARERVGRLSEPERSQQLEILDRLEKYGELYQKNPMAAPVKQSHIMYRSDPLPESMRARLRSLDYAPHVTDLLMKGLPITYGQDGRQVVEYPDGRRICVECSKIYDSEGKFQSYYYSIAGELEPAQR